MYSKSTGIRHNHSSWEAIPADNDLIAFGCRNQPLEILDFCGHEVIDAAHLTALCYQYRFGLRFNQINHVTVLIHCPKTLLAGQIERAIRFLQNVEETIIVYVINCEKSKFGTNIP